MAQYTIDSLPAPIDFGADRSPLKRTLQNAKNLLMCRAGEVPYNRYRGLTPELLDMPLPEMESELMPELDRVMSQEPDVEVVDAEVERLDDGDIHITVTLETAVKDA